MGRDEKPTLKETVVDLASTTNARFSSAKGEAAFNFLKDKLLP